MAIIETLNESQFHDAFHRMGRGNQFSYEGLNRLYDYYNDLTDDTGEDMEMDVIAICCEWVEYDDIEGLRADYPLDMEEEDDGLYLNELQDRTTFYELPNGHYLMQAF